jgi:hypothetical protein
LAATKKKKIPFEFVLDELAGIRSWTRQMSGCTAVYVEEKIVFLLRYKPDRRDRDDGISTTKVLPVDAGDFEESVLLACSLVRAGDPGIGKVPKPKRTAQKRKGRGGPSD